ncbi:MAG TPA: GEVED domain-containing protein, partial [Niabella sp.]
GFSAIQNPREVFLVLFKSDGTLADSIKLNNKPSDWHTGITQTLSATFQKPANTDNYKIGIWMPDYQGSAARLDARYAIRYCNLDWFNYNVSNGAMGINLLNRDSLNSYCAAPGDTDPADRFIQNLFTSGAVQNINYAATSYPAGGYMKFTSQQIVVQKGTSFTLSFTNSSNTKWARVIAWIDWNRDGIFDDATERIFYVGNAGSDNSATVLSISRTLSVPATATTGVIGMRIRLHDAWLPTAGPCGYQDNISSFDFFLKVL